MLVFFNEQHFGDMSISLIQCELQSGSFKQVKVEFAIPSF